jgi:hypothetical protein
MVTKSKWILLLLLLLSASCGIFKRRIVSKTDSVFIDRTKIVTERIVDTIVTIKSDTVEVSFTQPLRDTVFSLYGSNGGKVKIVYKNGVYSVASITKEKVVPIKIYEKKVEYRNIYVRDKDKSVQVKKINFDWLIFLIIGIIVCTLVVKSKIKHYASRLSTKIKFW